jgi:hypothetical protein
MGRCRTLKQTYQDLYDNTDYGKAEKGNSPTIYLMDHYKNWLKGSIIELGCGGGDGVLKLREMGFKTDGIDQVDLNNNMLVGDITKPLDLDKYYTSICIDVFEHIDDNGIKGLLENMQQTYRQVISVHNKRAAFKGKNGEQLHINIKPFEDWSLIITKYFNICSIVEVTDYLRIYFCENKNN